MRDAFGGIVNIVIIVVFLVIVSGYLAFNVNYTKAFRVKNKIISTFEQYEGTSCENADSECDQKIQEYMQSLGYSAPDFNIKDYTCKHGYCYKRIDITNQNSDISDTKQRAYYKIVTQINIDIPIINKIMPGLKIFQVTGDTKPIVIGRWYRVNVIITNKQQSKLSTLDIDIIKSISGTYEASEIVEMFKNFFYSKMILDVTAIKDYNNINSFQTIVQGLDVEKIVFFLPEGSSLCTSNFLSKLISMGIYNFTTNIDGVKYLLKKSNTYKDVEHIQKISKPVESDPITTVTQRVTDAPTIIGVKSVTEHAGSTTFIYILKKELEIVFGSRVIAIEINKNDFQLFNDKSMISIPAANLKQTLDKYNNASIILIDLNDLNDDSMCGDVFYLLEPSTIRLNKLLKRNRTILNKLKNKKVILNKSLLSNKDVNDFEYEANIKVFYNMPPLNERKRNDVVSDFLYRIGLLERDIQGRKEGANKIFGLFRR